MAEYRYDKVDELEKHGMVGSKQCVALVQIYTGAPSTSLWRQGDAAIGNTTLKKGTAIATFVNGRYPNRSSGNHAALFVRQAPGGIYILDQWKTKSTGKISSRFVPSRGVDKNGRYKRPSDNADAFSVIK